MDSAACDDLYRRGGRARAKRGKKGGCDENASCVAILVVIAIILIMAIVWTNCGRAGRDKRDRFCSSEGCETDPSPEGFNISSSPSPDAMAGNDAPERRSVHAALSRLYSTADVDPLVTGQMYAFADDVRNVYAQRTSHGDVHGLTEYASNGSPGELGVDVGPFGLNEYGGEQIGFDDGIPEQWAVPSTPIRWYRPKQRDYYGPEGPVVYSEGMYSLTEPDHDPLTN